MKTSVGRVNDPAVDVCQRGRELPVSADTYRTEVLMGGDAIYRLGVVAEPRPMMHE
jgi:hypothetical protein